MKKLTALIVALTLGGMVGTASAQTFVRSYPKVSGPTTISTTTCSNVTTSQTGCLVVGLEGATTVGVQIDGTFSATLEFEVSNNGTTWSSVTLAPPDGGAAVDNAVAAGFWQGSPVAKYFRVKASTYSSGSPAITIVSVNGGGASGGAGGGGSVSNGGTFAVQESGTALTALQSIDGKLTSGITIGNGSTSDTEDNSIASGQSNVALTVGLSYIYNGSAWVRPPTNTGNSSTSTPRVVVATDQPAFEVYPVPTATSGSGLSTCYITSGASTNATSCKGSAGNVYAVRMVNTTSTLYYLRMYNSSSAPTCSSSTGFVETIPAPHGTGTGGGVVAVNGGPQAYGTGIGFCLTGGGSSTDNTNAATGVYVTILYK